MRALTGEWGFDVIFDFVGAQGTLDSALPLLAPGGSLSVVGSGGGRLAIGKDVGLPPGWGIAAPFWGPRSDLVEVVELARAGVVSAEIEVFGLDEALSAYELLRSGGIRGRAVVVPQHSPQRLPSMDNGGDLDRAPTQR
jgi:propanol-preferring alcohol dehydrogenase